MGLLSECALRHGRVARLESPAPGRAGRCSRCATDLYTAVFHPTHARLRVARENHVHYSHLSEQHGRKGALQSISRMQATAQTTTASRLASTLSPFRSHRPAPFCSSHNIPRPGVMGVLPKSLGHCLASCGCRCGSSTDVVKRRLAGCEVAQNMGPKVTAVCLSAQVSH